MNCPHCGSHLDNSDRFCFSCGQPVQVAEQPKGRQEFCVSCGSELPEDAQFCQECGTPVEPPEFVPSTGDANASTASTASETAVIPPVSGPTSGVQAFDPAMNGVQGNGASAYRAVNAGDASKRQLSKGAIAGIVVAAVVVVVLVAVGVAAALGAFSSHESTKSETVTVSQESDSSKSDSSSSDSKSSQTVKVKQKLADYSWADLVKIADEIESKASNRNDAIKIAAGYNLVKSDGTMTGDKKTLETSAGSTDVFIVDIYVDKLSASTSKCAAFTFGGSDILTTHAMNSSATNSGGWSKSTMRDWLNNTVSASFPTDLKTAVKQVVKKTNNTGKSTSTSCVTESNDKVWLFSWVECLGPISWNTGASTSYIDEIDNQEGSQYAWFKQQGVAGEQSHSALVRCARGSSTEGVWWMRSSAPNTSTSFGDMGPEIDNGGTASTSEGVVIGFCL